MFHNQEEEYVLSSEEEEDGPQGMEAQELIHLKLSLTSLDRPVSQPMHPDQIFLNTPNTLRNPPLVSSDGPLVLLILLISLLNVYLLLQL